MAIQILNIQKGYNQRLTTAVEVAGKILDLELLLAYNRMAGYWVVTIKDLSKNLVVLSSMPLLAHQNLLGQYGYLEIGSCGVVNISGGSDDNLDDTNLGTDFLWCWDDVL